MRRKTSTAAAAPHANKGSNQAELEAVKRQEPGVTAKLTACMASQPPASDSGSAGQSFQCCSAPSCPTAKPTRLWTALARNATQVSNGDVLGLRSVCIVQMPAPLGMPQLCSPLESMFPGYTLCGTATDTACFNLQSDSQHCGTCGTVCTGNSECTEGACTCKQGFVNCIEGSTDCVTDLQSDALHCGACGSACQGGKECQEGTCACPRGMPPLSLTVSILHAYASAWHSSTSDLPLYCCRPVRVQRAVHPAGSLLRGGRELHLQHR